MEIPGTACSAQLSLTQQCAALNVVFDVRSVDSAWLRRKQPLHMADTATCNATFVTNDRIVLKEIDAKLSVTFHIFNFDIQS